MEQLKIVQDLVSLLREEVGEDYSDHFIYPYLLLLEDHLGSDQDVLELISKRLAFCISYDRYDQTGSDPWNEGITLREIIYYEFFYFLKYGLPFLREGGYTLSEILGMNYSEFKPIFKKFYPQEEYEEEHYQCRVSYLTDYAQERLQK